MRPKPRPTYEGQRETVILDLPKGMFEELRSEAESSNEDLGVMIFKIFERRQIIKDLHHYLK